MKNPNATVTSIDEFNALDASVTTIIIDNGVNDPEFTQLDLTRFTQLQSLVIGQRSFAYVETVNITGLEELESVEIDTRSFSMWDIFHTDPNRHFYLKNCPSLRELKIGYSSFSEYSVFEIENVNALESIEMGGWQFAYASLELKGILLSQRVMTRPALSQITHLW